MNIVEDLAKRARECYVSSKKLYDMAEVVWKTKSVDELIKFIRCEVARGTLSPDFAAYLEKSIRDIDDTNQLIGILKDVGKLKDFYYIEPLYNDIENIKKIIGASVIFNFNVFSREDYTTIYIIVDKAKNVRVAGREISKKYFGRDKVKIFIKLKGET